MLRRLWLRWWPALLLGLWGLTPLLWFHGRLLITEDLRLPPTLAQWSRTLWAWYPWVGAGVESTLDASLIVFQAIPACCRALGGFTIVAQQVSFVWWFLLAGVGMYQLALRLLRGDRVAALVATSFYLFNPWLDQVWSSFKPPLVTGYAVVPWLLAVMLDGVEDRQPFSRVLGWVALLSVIGAAIGNNISETLAVLCPLILFAGVVLLRHAVRRDAGRLWQAGRRLAALGAVALLSGAFWLIPQGAALLSQLRGGTPEASESLSRDWLQGISVDTSFFHVIRLQGDWTWYNGFAGEPYRTYAAWYHASPVLVLLGWAIPLVVLAGLLMGRSRYRFFVMSLIGVGVLFSMGVHPPMGMFYQWLVDHVPYFWIVRSPYFKFMFLTCLGYTVAIGAAYQLFAGWLARARTASWGPGLLAAGLIASHLVYAGPFVLGKMYALPSERTRLPANHLTIPRFVDEGAAWLNAQPGFFRIYHLPAKEAHVTRWGYAGAFPLLSYFSTHPELFEYQPNAHLFAQGAKNEAAPITRLIWKGLYEGATDRVAQLLRLFNVRYLLHDTSIIHDLIQVPGAITYDDPAFLRTALARQKGISRGKTFGPWELYDVADPLPRAYHVPAATLVIGDSQALLPLTQIGDLQAPAVVTTAQTPAETVQRLVAAGAFDRLVLMPGARWPEPTWPALPTWWLAVSTQLTKQVDPAQARPLLPTAAGFSSEEPFPGGGVGRPLESNAKPNWTFTNPTAHPQNLQLTGTVWSPQESRGLFAYLDGKLLQVFPIPPDHSTTVTLDVTVPPGTHAIAWYSPNARTQRPNGQQVGFVFKQDWIGGPPAWMGTWESLPAGRYRVAVIPGPAAMGRPFPVIRLGATRLPVTSGTTEVAWGGGPAPLMITESGEAPYTVVITPIPQPKASARPLTLLPPTRSRPTAHTVPALPGPGWVILTEAYHPGWKIPALSDATHVEINGFANGYFLRHAAPSGLSVVFLSQRWVLVGWGISLMTWLGVLAAKLFL